jgi:YidC/Oxa1 family membrane protein insertase
MKLDKTTLLGVAVCLVLLLSWGRILQWMGYTTEAPPARETVAPVQPSSPDAAPSNVPAPISETSAPVESSPAVPVVPVAPLPVPDDLRARAQKTWPVPGAAPVAVEAEDGTFGLRIDPNGGGVTRVVLGEYFEDTEKGGASEFPVTLGRAELPLCALNLAQAGWTAGPGEVLDHEPGRVRIRRQVAGPSGQSALLIEEWAVVGPDAPYQFDYSVRLESQAGQPVSLAGAALEAGGMPPTTSPQRGKTRTSATSGIMISQIGAKRPLGLGEKSLEKMKPLQREELRQTPANWVAVHSQYFTFVVLAPEDRHFSGLMPSFETFPQDPAKVDGRAAVVSPWYRGRILLPELSATATGGSSLTLRCYAGPKKLQVLSALPNGVDKVMGIDTFMWMTTSWMGWLTRLMLGCLVRLKVVFSGSWGYGWAIIVITMVVKLLFFPLSHKGTQSMRKMQALQPQLKELRERYKDDAQKMYRKQQELFKENNVSQLGGCLPMAVQIPVFFALYNTFRSAIELRQASFLWVADLSLPDTLAFSPEGLPIRPLAIIMSATMLVQQKMTPAADPNQQRMMMFMSLFFLWIFYGMPAGLTLYWTTNQVLTIVQTLITHRLEERQKAAKAATGGPSAQRA